MRIYHLATESDWAQAQETGAYTTSTRGVTLEQEGFLHASREDQWRGVLERYYADVEEPLLLLEIDTDLLDVAVARGPGRRRHLPARLRPARPRRRGARRAGQRQVAPEQSSSRSRAARRVSTALRPWGDIAAYDASPPASRLVSS